MVNRSRPLRLLSLVVVLGLVAGACSGSADTTSDADTTTAAVATTASAQTVAPLTVVVTNDDGIDAPGIDVLVNALDELDDVEVVVVAPAENQSGTGAKTTSGDVSYEKAETASGVEGTAVEGYPADTIAVALDDLGIEPDVVASGVNQGQNVGPVAQISGTVGAAVTAVRRGIPAVAGSAGMVDDADYAFAAQLMVEWIVEHRDDLASGKTPADAVVNINVPECTAGEPRGVEEVPLAEEIPEDVVPFTADCAVELETDDPRDDVMAIATGFAAITEIPESELDPPDEP